MNKSRILRWAVQVVKIEEGRSAFKILTGKPTGKKSPGKTYAQMEGQYLNES